MKLTEVLAQMRADLKKIAKDAIDADAPELARHALDACSAISIVRNSCNSHAVDMAAEFVQPEREEF